MPQPRLWFTYAEAMFFSIASEPSLTCGELRLDRTFNFAEIEILRAERLEAPAGPWPFTVLASRTNPLVLDDYYPSAHLMSRRMIEVLTSAGVSNLQRFDAILTERGTGVVHGTHQVVNVISAVKSKVVREGGTYVFSLKNWSPSVLVFRIASGLVVTEAIANVLRGAGLRNLALEPLPTTHIDAS